MRRSISYFTFCYNRVFSLVFFLFCFVFFFLLSAKKGHKNQLIWEFLAIWKDSQACKYKGDLRHHLVKKTKWNLRISFGPSCLHSYPGQTVVNPRICFTLMLESGPHGHAGYPHPWCVTVPSLVQRPSSWGGTLTSPPPRISIVFLPWGWACHSHCLHPRSSVGWEHLSHCLQLSAWLQVGEWLRSAQQAPGGKSTLSHRTLCKDGNVLYNSC